MQKVDEPAHTWRLKDVRVVHRMDGRRGRPRRCVVVFFSPSVITRYGEPTGALRGKHALREHFRRGLETLGAKMRFTILDVLSGVNGYTVYYSRENGAAFVDTVIIDALGKGVQAHAHYHAA